LYLISFYVPETHVQEVKNALYDKGAGKFNNYDSCSWQTMGTGEFRPLKGSAPFIGEIGKISRVVEYKIEMVCKKSILIDVLKTLVKVHPYEEPAYHVIEIITLDNSHEAGLEILLRPQN